MRQQKLWMIGIAALSLSACATTSQYTSGADYLARYNTKSAYSAATSHNSISTPAIDSEIREIAAIEPNLEFPARIGLARIEQGQLIGVPHDEAEYWRASADRLGHGFGQFIPVSPLVAEMVGNGKPHFKGNVVNHIRRGAARQHLDYVIAYEVNHKSESQKNELGIADLSILGLFVLPSRNVDVQSTASAILMDVRNGYPYLTGSTFADKSGISTLVGRSDKKDRLKDASRIVAVDKISDEFAQGLKELKLVSDGIKLAEHRVQRGGT